MQVALVAHVIPTTITDGTVGTFTQWLAVLGCLFTMVITVGGAGATALLLIRIRQTSRTSDAETKFVIPMKEVCVFVFLHLHLTPILARSKR